MKCFIHHKIRGISVKKERPQVLATAKVDLYLGKCYTAGRSHSWLSFWAWFRANVCYLCQCDSIVSYAFLFFLL